VPLKLAGSGPEESALRDLNAELGEVGEFLGFKSGDALHALIRGARAVVLPSQWYENAPMSVLEAFALGKPVIGADIGGIPELIDARVRALCTDARERLGALGLTLASQAALDGAISALGDRAA
jgi:glycosyltransferase involved in cell wall biosynthesis